MFRVTDNNCEQTIISYSSEISVNVTILSTLGKIGTPVISVSDTIQSKDLYCLPHFIQRAVFVAIGHEVHDMGMERLLRAEPMQSI